MNYEDAATNVETGVADEANGHVRARLIDSLNDQLIVMSGFAGLCQANLRDTEKTESYVATIATAGSEARHLIGDLAALEEPGQHSINVR